MALPAAWSRPIPVSEVSQHPDIQAIVVLGNGHVSDPAIPERAWQTTSPWRTLEGFAWLANPEAELVSPAPVAGDPLSNAEVSARMAASLGIPRARMTLFETTKTPMTRRSASPPTSTAKQVALVSSATHLPRAMALYRSQGLDAVPAPGITPPSRVRSLQPSTATSPGALSDVFRGCHS